MFDIKISALIAAMLLVPGSALAEPFPAPGPARYEITKRPNIATSNSEAIENEYVNQINAMEFAHETCDRDGFYTAKRNLINALEKERNVLRKAVRDLDQRNITAAALLQDQDDSDSGEREALSQVAELLIKVGQLEYDPDCVAPDTQAAIFMFGPETGVIDRMSTGILGYEFGGMISPRSLAYFSNDGDFSGFSGWLTFVPPAFPHYEVTIGGNVLQADVDALINSIQVGAGNSHLVFSPEGILGGLGGGVNFGARDFENVSYSNEYQRQEIYIKKTIPVFEGSPVETRAGIWGGISQVDLDESIQGEVATLVQDFRYSNRADIFSVNIGAGFDVETEVGQLGNIPVEFYGGLWYQVQFNDGDGRSQLDLNGVINASEGRNVSTSAITGALDINGAFEFEFSENTSFIIGGRYRFYETPAVVIPPQQTARLQWQDATEFGGFVRLKHVLGTPVPEAD